MTTLYKTRTCSTCEHFIPVPNTINGECRALPPASHLTPLQSLFVPGGVQLGGEQYNVRTIYPQIPRQFCACSQYVEDIYADDGTKPPEVQP